MPSDDKAVTINIAYHPTPYPRAMRGDIEEISEVCDGIYLPFAEADLDYWGTKVKGCIEIAHDCNLIVTADFWGYGNLFASGGIPSLFTLRHPECNCVTNTGRPAPKSCPNKPAVRAFMKRAVEDFIERFEPDGVFWDEPSFLLGEYLGKLDNGEWLCRCDDCRRLFKEKHGQEMPTARTPEVEQFQAETMLDFLSDLCGYVKGCGDHLLTSTCVMPGDARALKEAVAKTRDLDIFGIDPYWWPDSDVAQEDFVGSHTREAVELGHTEGKLVEAWVCAYKQWAGHEHLAYRAAKLAANEDIDYISAWSYMDYVSWEQSDRENRGDPEQVWKGLRRAFHEIREGDLEVHL